jgi:hypothetical protein
MKRLILLALVFWMMPADAKEEIKWSKGCIVDTKGRVIGGEVSHQSIDLVLFRSNDKVMVYNPYHVKSFSYYDEELKISRKFSSAKIESSRVPLFYEVVVRGDVQVIKVVTSRVLLTGLVEPNHVEYKIRWNTKLVSLNDFKTDVYPDLIKACPLLKQFANEQRLSPSNLKGILSIAYMYNKLTANPTDLTGSVSIVTH